MNVRTFTGGGFGENAYLTVCEPSKAAAVVDPGADSSRMVAVMLAEGVDLRAILLTHAHVDHVEGVGTIREQWPDVPIWLHPDALGMYRRAPAQAAAFGMRMVAQPEPTHELAHGQRLDIGDCTLDVRLATGHAPGHVILIARDKTYALVGDVVFHRSIGRTDFPGGDYRTLMESIRDQVLTLPDTTVLYSGHGPPTTVGDERANNPFLAGLSGGDGS